MASRSELIAKWRKFLDRELGVPLGWDDDVAWKRFAERVVNVTSRAEIVRLGEDTKDCTWPESYGESPWELMSSVSYLIRHPDCVRRDRSGQIADLFDPR